ELLRDRSLQLRNTVDGGVFRLTALDGLDRRLLDVVRRVEIGLAGAEADHVKTRSLQLARFAGNRHGRRRLDPFERAGDQSHVYLLKITQKVGAGAGAP